MSFLTALVDQCIPPRLEVPASRPPPPPPPPPQLRTETAWSGGSSFTASVSTQSRGPNLTGFSTSPVFFTPPQQQGPEKSALDDWLGPQSPVPVTESGEIALGTVSHRDESKYSNEVAPVLSGEDPNLSYCAITAFEGLAERYPEWGTEAEIHEVMTHHENRSSIEVWDQLRDQLGEEGLTDLVPPDQQVATRVFEETPPTIELTDAEGGNALGFTVDEVHTRNDTASPTTLRESTPAFSSLADMEVGDVRAVCTRPLDTNLESAEGNIGHWVLVERTDDGYRIIQSAPEHWALLGASGGGTPDGGVYTQEFSGPDALQDVSHYLHAEAQQMTPSGRYAVMVLTPEMHE
jgi:hypothetical protein